MKKAPARPAARRRRRIVWICCATAALLGLVVAGCFAEKYWPYRYREVKPLLQDVFASQIKIDHYHRTYLPRPGFVATGLTLRRNSAQGLPPLGSAQKLIVQGSWMDLLMLRNRVQLVDVVGLHIVVPPTGSEASRKDFPPGSSSGFTGPQTMVETLHLRDAVLEIQRKHGESYSFPIRDLVLHNLHKGNAMNYAVDMQNATPKGHILSSGSFGPLKPNNLGATPVSGDFTFAPVDLAEFGKISGTLSSKGHFAGTLAAIRAGATEDTPDFAIGKGRPTDIAATVQCTVDGLNGDVVLYDIDARMEKSEIHVQGSVMGSPKSTHLEATISKGRVQDLLRPFLQGPSPLEGDVWLRSRVLVEPSRHGATFFDRLRAEASFDVPAERLTKPATEKELSAFSERAQTGKTAASGPDQREQGESDVLSSLKSRLTIQNGVMSTQKATFEVPGATVELHGIYDLKSKRVDMTGQLAMQADISHVTTGWKSFLLKPFAIFFRKKKAGAVIPIAVTGGPGHYKVGQDLLHDK